MPFKNNNYFTLNNLSKYGQITLKFVGRFFTWLLQYFPKNIAILVQKFWGEKKLSKFVFGYFKTKKKKKVPMAIKRGGLGKALMACPLGEKLFFCGFPYPESF